MRICSLRQTSAPQKRKLLYSYHNQSHTKLCRAIRVEYNQSLQTNATFQPKHTTFQPKHINIGADLLSYVPIRPVNEFTTLEKYSIFAIWY